MVSHNIDYFADPDKNGEEYVRKRLKQLFLKKTNEIKSAREADQQALTIAIKHCKLSERAYLNQKNFKIYFHHTSHYKLVQNAYHALLHDYLQVNLKPGYYSRNQR